MMRCKSKFCCFLNQVCSFIYMTGTTQSFFFIFSPFDSLRPKACIVSIYLSIYLSICFTK